MPSEDVPEFFRSMESIASTLPDVPEDVVESQLVTFDVFMGLIGEDWRDSAVALLRGAAGRCADPQRQKRVLEAADAVAKREPCALTPEGRTWKQAAEASTITAPAAMPGLGLWDMFPGMVVRVGQAFRDYDGTEIPAGQILHFLNGDYFAYDDGHTLTFREMVIRLSGNVSGEDLVIQNAGNAWFEPVPDIESLQSCWELIDRQWNRLDMSGVKQAAEIRAEIDACGAWLRTTGNRGPAPMCVTGLAAAAAFAEGRTTYELGFRIPFLFAGIGACS